MEDLGVVARDKYGGDTTNVTPDDKARLAEGEPLAYVIGWVPFLGCTLALDSRPLIPRPETEWWVETLIKEIDTKPLTILDLCAGSGCIGVALLKHAPHVRVTFAELDPAHAETIQGNISRNDIDPHRAEVLVGDLYDALPQDARYDLIVCNPPYIPQGRVLAHSLSFEPSSALCAGSDGMLVMRRVLHDIAAFLTPGAQLWLEGDVENVEAARECALYTGAVRAEVRTDQYDRPRLVVAWYP
jgi:HemK-like putative methylase